MGGCSPALESLQGVTCLVLSGGDGRVDGVRPLLRITSMLRNLQRLELRQLGCRALDRRPAELALGALTHLRFCGCGVELVSEFDMVRLEAPRLHTLEVCDMSYLRPDDLRWAVGRLLQLRLLALADLRGFGPPEIAVLKSWRPALAIEWGEMSRGDARLLRQSMSHAADQAADRDC